MTIKELEETLGLPRATVRYYEQEGLLAPARGANGYRDYSQADLALLRKIKLLRRLGVEVDTLRQLQAGQVSLPDVLEIQTGKKGEQKGAVAREEALCARLAREGLPFDALDPEPWLAQLEAGPDPALPPAKEEPKEPHPWRRYFARMFDLSLYHLILTSVAVLLFHQPTTPWSGTVFGILYVYSRYALMFLLEPLMLHYWGTTPGKALFAIKLRDYKGDKLTVKAARARLWELFARGMFYGIPLLTEFRMWDQWVKCHSGEPSSWSYDAQGRTERLEVPAFKGYFLSYGLGRALVYCLSTVLLAYSLQAPNRGELTMEQFVENYNFYNQNVDTLHVAPLTPDGAIAPGYHGGQLNESSFTEDYVSPYDPIGQHWEPVVKEGKTVGFTFHADYPASNSFIYSPFDVTETKVGLLAFLGSRESVGPLDLYSYRWAFPLPWEWNYTFVWQGYKVTQKTTYPELYPDFAGKDLIAFPGDQEAPIHLEFTIRKATVGELMSSVIWGHLTPFEMRDLLQQD